MIDALEAQSLLAPLKGYRHVLLAVSGGADSLGMMALIATWAQAQGAEAPKLSVATVDHRLRPEGAVEAEYVAELAKTAGLDHATLAWLDPKPSNGLQEAARHARYGLLKGHSQNIDAEAVVLAHHLDDQAETVLMRLCAGSGVSGLAGMADSAEWYGLRLLRPFLSLAGARLRATADAVGWLPMEDPSNQKKQFTRVRFRQASNLLTSEGLDAQRVGRFAERMKRADAALERWADYASTAFKLPDSAGILWSAGLLEEPDEIILRVLIRAIQAMNMDKVPELSKGEAVVEALLKARKHSRTMRRTLGGVTISMDTKGLILMRPEKPRRVDFPKR
jgi:tRNA(Ile)-lysidine synthase